MATGGWLTRGAGQTSGRIVPQRFRAPAGSRIFVLGQESQTEPAQLEAGQYVHVQQWVDLTDVDLVGANAQTLGVELGAFARSTELSLDTDVYNIMAAWFFDRDWPHGENELGARPHLRASGAVESATEDYSFAGSFCRRIPAGATLAQLDGVNTPRLWGAAPLPAYTLDVWLDFDADAIADSDGVDPLILSCDDGDNGLIVDLAGEGGIGAQHRWWPRLTHRNSSVTDSVLFASAPITASAGWHLLTFVYDSTLVGVNRCKLYVDGVLSGTGGPGTMSIQPGMAALGCPIQVASKDLVGRFDQIRLLGQALDAGTIIAQYLTCISAPVTKAARWSMQLRIDGDIYCQRDIAADEEREWADFLAPVRHLTGSHRVEFVLQILEEP